MLQSHLTQGILTNAFQRKEHVLPSERWVFGLVSLKKVLVVITGTPYPTEEADFFLEYKAKNSQTGRPREHGLLACSTY